MSEILRGTATAQWHRLLGEAQAACERHLDESSESYLLFCLQRFLSRPEMAEAVLALEYLEGRALQGQRRAGVLRDVGDQCLLYSGFFPRRARRRRVPVQYYVDLGRAAYAQVAELESALAELFQHLSEDFVAMMDVLQAMKSLGELDPLLDPWEDAELVRGTGSRAARKRLQAVSSGFVVVDPEEPKAH